MTRAMLSLVLLASCDHRAVATTDASSCCDYLPDDDAVRACAALPPNTCGVVVCHLSDAAWVRLNVCGPKETR